MMYRLFTQVMVYIISYNYHGHKIILSQAYLARAAYIIDNLAHAQIVHMLIVLL